MCPPVPHIGDVAEMCPYNHGHTILSAKLNDMVNSLNLLLPSTCLLIACF